MFSQTVEIHLYNKPTEGFQGKKQQLPAELNLAECGKTNIVATLSLKFNKMLFFFFFKTVDGEHIQH